LIVVSDFPAKLTLKRFSYIFILGGAHNWLQDLAKSQVHARVREEISQDSATRHAQHHPAMMAHSVMMRIIEYYYSVLHDVEHDASNAKLYEHLSKKLSDSFILRLENLKKSVRPHPNLADVSVGLVCDKLECWR